MKKRILIYCFPLFLSLNLYCQSARENINGQVSFITPQNIYVRFASTEGISVHDTLYISSGEKLIPVLVVNNLSSTSCLCSAISDEDLPAGHLIIARRKTNTVKEDTRTLEDVKKETAALLPATQSAGVQVNADSSGNKISSAARKQRITGRISASSYSDFSNTAGPDLQRFRYTLSLSALNIANSGFSADTYISFRHTSGKWDEVRSNIFNAMKIYSLALKYQPDKLTNLSLGRQINPRISSIGSFDGLVVEKSLRRFSAGLTGGFRPDFLTYGFNPHLLQYGAYLSYDYNENGVYSGTSLAFMEQLNSGKTDRRFLYLQHYGSPVRNLSLFSSFEIDIFMLNNNKPVSTFDLTSLYASANYRLTKNFTVNGSYDARKNPVYYESFKTTTDSLIENSLRQSFSFGTSVRVSKSVMTGVQASWRSLKSDVLSTKNVSGYVTYSHAGTNYFTATLSGSYIETAYINGLNGGVSLLNTLLMGKIQTGIGYSYQDYRLPEGQLDIIRHTGKADLFWQAPGKISASLNYEITFEAGDIYNRLYLQVSKRF